MPVPPLFFFFVFPVSAQYHYSNCLQTKQKQLLKSNCFPTAWLHVFEIFGSLSKVTALKAAK
jgi:hypothetical protein